MAPEVTVFVDYQNLHMSAHEMWCDFGTPPEDCLLSPLLVADELVKGRAPGGALKEIRVYRGRPDPRKETRLAQATDRQAQAWGMDDPRVRMFRRPLSYPRDFGQPSCHERPREKGIDVSLAVDVVRLAIEKRYDVGIVCSRDTDLLPAIEAVMELHAAHIEVATWEGASRLRHSHLGKQLWCHQMNRDTWSRCQDRRAY